MRDHGIKVKTIKTPSLLEIRYSSYYPYGQQKEVLRSFLEADNTHLNYWGYEALVNEVGVPLMDARAAPFCRPDYVDVRNIEIVCSNRLGKTPTRHTAGNHRYFPY